MEHKLPALPYSEGALEPHMSTETLQYHHGKHHKAYVDKLNELIKGTKFEYMGLEEIILSAEGPLFNNAAQHWNHTFFWQCLTPDAGQPSLKFKGLIEKRWKTVDAFKEAFAKSAAENFGSGWTWLVEDKPGHLDIINTQNADTPKTKGLKALMAVDVWEHAYYIDYRNARPNYLNAFWSLVNWDFVEKNLQ
jgi:Fe-Mn family superoxide dismutase